jgi:hypothetical protein
MSRFRLGAARGRHGDPFRLFPTRETMRGEVRRVVSAGIWAGVALAAAACGGGEVKSVWHAGMSQDDAMVEAMNAAGREVRDPESPMYEHRIRPAVAQKGLSSTGRAAWVVRLRDLTEHAEICVALWADTALTARVYSYEIDWCEP